MSSIKNILSRGLEGKGIAPKEPEESKKHEDSEPAINELIERVFTTRNLVHFAHWNTNSYASHMALGDLYDEIVDEVRAIREAHAEKFNFDLHYADNLSFNLDLKIFLITVKKLIFRRSRTFYSNKMMEKFTGSKSVIN